MVQWFFVLAVMAAFFLAPAQVMGVSSLVGIFFGYLFLACVALAAGIYAYLKVTGKKASSLGFTVKYDAGLEKGFWVGSKGTGLPLKICDTAQGTSVEWATQNYIVLLNVLFCFGPGLLILYCYDPTNFHFNMPLPMKLMLGLCWAGIWWAFGYIAYSYCFLRKAVIISGASIRLLRGGRMGEECWKQNIRACPQLGIN